MPFLELDAPIHPDLLPSTSAEGSYPENSGLPQNGGQEANKNSNNQQTGGGLDENNELKSNSMSVSGSGSKSAFLGKVAVDGGSSGVEVPDGSSGR